MRDSIPYGLAERAFHRYEIDSFLTSSRLNCAWKARPTDAVDLT